MAKSVRASVSKRNRANLRKKVFGPLVDARTERLAAKLQEIAAQPKPQASGKSDVGLGLDESGTCDAIYIYLSLALSLPPSKVPFLTFPASIADQNQSYEKTALAGEGRLIPVSFRFSEHMSAKE